MTKFLMVVMVCAPVFGDAFDQIFRETRTFSARLPARARAESFVTFMTSRD